MMKRLLMVCLMMGVLGVGWGQDSAKKDMTYRGETYSGWRGAQHRAFLVHEYQGPEPFMRDSLYHQLFNKTARPLAMVGNPSSGDTSQYLFTGRIQEGHRDSVRPIIISGVTFQKAFDFRETKFFGLFRIGEDTGPVVFQKEVNFSKCTFLKDTNQFQLPNPNISAANFDSIADFSESTFMAGAGFSHDSLKQGISFRGASFQKGTIFFRDTYFKGNADFTGAVVSDSSVLVFKDCRFPDTMNFSYFKVQNEMNLMGIASDSFRIGKTGHPCYIILYQTDLSKFHLDYENFQLLPVDDTGGALTRDEAISLYEALLKNFKDRGQEESYQKLDIEYQQYKWRTNPVKITSWFGPVSDAWWQFGYAKHRVFGWTLFLLIIFTILTLPMLPFLQRNIYPLEPLTRKEEEPDGHPYHGLRRLWYSFVYTGTLFFKLTLKTENIRFDSRAKNIWGTLYVLMVYTIGVVCLAYMANFVLQK